MATDGDALTTMEVAAVSQAEPQWHNIRGQRVQTSIIHIPMTRKCEFIALEAPQGIEGNCTAVHNAEVYAFFAHHYDYWSNRLKVARNTWGWCHWGENITFQCPESLSEADFHLGDVWKVGTDAVLQVCGSRVPCFKLAWRCGQKDNWLKPLAESGKCGVYFKVIRGGKISPGDTAELVSKRPHGPLIDCATITRVAFSDAQSTRATMHLLQDDPNLLDMNKVIFRRKLGMLCDQELVGKNTWKGWLQARVVAVVDESPIVKSFYIALPSTSIVGSKKGLAAYLPGQFITVRLPNSLIRPWSLSSYPSEASRESPEQYRISIKRNGKASAWMHDNCVPGTFIDIRAPSGSFCLDWSPQFPGRQIYVSAGIGITPMMSMLQAHLQHQALQRSPAVWIHVSQNYDTVPFTKELIGLLARSEALKLDLDIILFLTKSSVADCAATEALVAAKSGPNNNVRVKPGRPTIEDLRPLISSPYYMDPLRITPIEVEGRFSTVYICGSPTFDTSMRRIFETLGVSEAMILSETFSTAAVSSSPSIKRSQVAFTRSKRVVAWEPQRGKCSEGKEKDSIISLGNNLGPTLLELAEEVGLVPDHGCRTGVCGACEVSLSCGKLTGGLQPDGKVRICIARPASDEVAVDL